VQHQGTALVASAHLAMVLSLLRQVQKDWQG
jgi:hypothetical protein